MRVSQPREKRGAVAWTAAIIGSGYIGSDLMMKILKGDGQLKLAALVGIDPGSDGLARARRLGVEAIDTGVDGLIASPVFEPVTLVFDATSASAHPLNAARLTAARPGIRLIDLTPAAPGPYCIPAVNLDQHIDALNLNMVSCGGQAAIPIVAAISSVTEVAYAETVAAISSRSAGPATRASIDELTETTARAICEVGGAGQGKAMVSLSPAEPPLPMHETVFVLSGEADRDAIVRAVEAMVATVADYVPGYRLKQEVQFDRINEPVNVPGVGSFTGLKTTVVLEVEGAADYLPAYAGNLDILTSAALRVGQRIAARLAPREGGLE